MIVAPPHPRSPWQRLYGAAHGLRRRWYAERARRLPRPVVSVGNLHWGGTGKTPLVAANAARLRDRGLRVAILSRGYRSRGRGVRIVSTGEGPLLGPLVAGDEPVLLAGELPGVAVVVAADRYRAGIHAVERLSPGPQVFLLDDGFSHLALARELDVLVLPAADPFGGGRLPPTGRLREPLAAVARAHAAVLADGGPGEGPELERGLAAHGFEGRGFTSRTDVLPPRGERNAPLARGSRVVVVLGIARPHRVLEALQRSGFQVVETLVFPDHHPYPPSSLQKIETARRRTRAHCVLTTAKDHVKLLGRLESPLAVLPIQAVPEPAFWAWLDGELAARCGLA